MTAITLPPNASQPAIAQRRRDWYLAALLLLTASGFAAIVAGQLSGRLPAAVAQILALATISVAAYHRNGWQTALVLIALFGSAYLPAAFAPGTSTFQALMALGLYVLALVIFAYLATTLATFVRARTSLTGAVRGWEALLSRASSLDEVTIFLLKESALITDAEQTALILQSPVTNEWEVIWPAKNALEHMSFSTEASDISLVRWLLGQADPQMLNDLDGDPRFAGASQATLQSVLAMHLRQPDGQVLAVLVLGNKPGGFGEDDLDALYDLQAAGEQALLQAGAIARTDDVLTRRMRELTALQRSARELSASLDPNRIVDETLAHAIDIANGDAGLIAIDTTGLAPMIRMRNGSLSEVQVKQIMAWIARRAAPQLDLDGSVPLPSLLPVVSSRLIVPVRRHGQTLGVVVVESATPRVFGEVILRTLGGLADHAAVALDNARLFDRILREKRKSEQIVRTITDALFTTDDTGHITSFNPAAALLTGWGEEEALGHGVCDVLGCRDDGDCSQHCRLIAALQAPAPVIDDHWTIRQRLGAQRVVALSAAPLEPEEDQAGGLVVLMRDVTEQSKMEAFQQELIASFSHELRTPLANIGTITQMLLVEDEVVAAHQGVREQLHLLEAQSKRLEEFAERFLTLSQLECKELPLELQPVAVNLLAQTAVHQWHTLQPERPVSFAAPAQPLWAWADEQAVRMVIEVLLDNARKYTLPDTPVEVRVSIDLTDLVTVAVQDKGLGLRPEDQSHIFERFYRVDNSDARTVYGHGLGLYIAREIVEAMDGQIWVESDLGTGSCFAFTLPLIRREDTDEDLDY